MIALLALINLLVIAFLFYEWYFWKKPCCIPCDCPTPEPCLVLFKSGVLSPEQILAVSTDAPIVLPAVTGKFIQYIAGFIRFVPGSVAYTDPPFISGVFFSFNKKNSSAGVTTLVAFNNQLAFNPDPLFASPTIVALNMRQIQGLDGNTKSLPLYFSIFSANLNPTGAGNGILEYYIYYNLYDAAT